RIINGNVSVSKGYTYTLQPTAKGKGAIGASRLEYRGNTYTSKPVTVDVVDVKPQLAKLSVDLEKFVFVQLSVNKSEVYVYEQVILSFKLYFQRGLPLSDIDYVPPTIKNFMEEKLGDQRQFEEIKDGIIYNVLELRTAVFPIIPGDLIISPAKLKCDLIIPRQRESLFGDAFFDDFFGREQRRFPIERATESVIIKAKPLPEQVKPIDFKGAVGSYNMEVSTKAQQVKVGDPITLSISVYGEGNIQTVSEPLLLCKKETDFKLYPAEVTTQITNRDEIIRGRKAFSKVIEPQKADIKSIPAILFSYFDPSVGQYKTIAKDPMPITVEAGQQEMPIQLTISGDNSPSNKQHAQIITQDILPIMANVPSLRNQGLPLYKNPLVLGCLVIPALVVIASVVITRRKEKLQTDIGYARNKRAYLMVKKRLAAAQTLLSQNNPDHFYSTLSRSVTDYLADKFNISAASAAHDSMVDMLRQRGIEDAIAEEVSRCLVDLDYRRFSKAGGTEEEMDVSCKHVEQLILKLERQLS
ncbi:MAG: BatD family protein, partial [Planctomycetota bacterium]